MPAPQPEAASLDPYDRPLRVPAQVRVAITGAAALMTIVYLGQRAIHTLHGASPVAASVLFGAEVLGAVVFGLRAVSAVADPVQPVDLPGVDRPSVTAVVELGERSLDELRLTLVACRRVGGVDAAVVVAPDASPWVRSVSARYGARVVDDADVFSTIAAAGAAWVLVLRAGDRPMPDLVDLSATVCSVPEAGIVQLGFEEIDVSGLGTPSGDRRGPRAFDRQVVRPSLAGRGSIPWYGDGPALVRPFAIRPDSGAITTVDHGLAAVRAGYAVTMIPRTLARVPGTGTPTERRRARRRRAEPLHAAAAGRLGGIDRTTRRAHRVALAEPLASVQLILLVVAAVAVLGFEQAPLADSSVVLLVTAVASYTSRWLALLVLGRARLAPLDLLRTELRGLAVDLPFVDRFRPDLPLLGVVVVTLSAAVVAPAVTLWSGSSTDLPAGTTTVALVLAAGLLAVAVEVLFDATGRHQRRDSKRVRIGMVTCRFGDHDGLLFDLSTGGLSVVVDGSPRPELMEGRATTVAFRIPDADGAWRSVMALVRVVHVAPERDGMTRYGLAFDEATDTPLDPVIEFLTIDRRLVTLGRRSAPAGR